MNSQISNPYIKPSINEFIETTIDFNATKITEDYIRDYFNVEEILEDPLKPDLKRFPTIKKCLESEWMKNHPYYEMFDRSLHYSFIKKYYLTDNGKARDARYKIQNEHQAKIIARTDEDARRDFIKMCERQDRKKKVEHDMKILEAFGITLDEKPKNEKKKKKNKK